MNTEVQRKLTTILAADAAGFSRAMDLDELSTLEALRAARRVFARFIERHHGRVVNTAGDGLIAEFPSVVEAVQCAIEVQNELQIDARGQSGALRFRIGIHLGDVMIDGDDLLGEGVNLASRLESMAEPGGVLISRQVYDQVQKKLSVGFEYLGEKRPKNFVDDVSVYRISLGRNKLRSALDWRKAEPEQPSTSVPRASTDRRERLLRHGRLLAALWVVLLLIDIASGRPFWAHWPGLVMAVFLAMEAAPLFVSGWLRLAFVRAGVLLAGLLLVNLFTWSGYLWVLWPAAVLVLAELLRRLIAGYR